MQVKVNFPTRIAGARNAKQVFKEAEQFYLYNLEYIDQQIYNFIFVNVGPELNSGTIFRVPVIKLNKRIMALYFRLGSYKNDKVEVTLVSVVYAEAYPPLPDSDIPHSIEHKPTEAI